MYFAPKKPRDTITLVVIYRPMIREFPRCEMDFGHRSLTNMLLEHGFHQNPRPLGAITIFRRGSVPQLTSDFGK